MRTAIFFGLFYIAEAILKSSQIKPNYDGQGWIFAIIFVICIAQDIKELSK